MPELWMPDVPVVHAWLPGTSATPERVVWDTLERDYSAHPRMVAAYLNRVSESRDLVWNPATGEIVQMQAAGSTIRIGVIAKAVEPFTNTDLVNAHFVIEWIRSLGIPDRWPAGPPMTPEVEGNRDVAIWGTEAGHYGISQVPGGMGTGPGAIDIRRLMDTGGDRTASG